MSIDGNGIREVTAPALVNETALAAPLQRCFATFTSDGITCLKALDRSDVAKLREEFEDDMARLCAFAQQRLEEERSELVDILLCHVSSVRKESTESKESAVSEMWLPANDSERGDSKG